jgi:hypothetical protein
MNQGIFSLAEVSDKIRNGDTLLLAGEETLLEQLPKGKWIAGTIPYFIAPDAGGLVSQEKIFVTDISAVVKEVRIEALDQDQLGKVYSGGEGSDFSFIIIPAMSGVHSGFALNAPNFKDFGARPLVGWISGVHLDDLGKASPKVFNGESGLAEEQKAMVMHVSLVAGKTVDVGIINLFEQGDGDTLTFFKDGFSCTDVAVNGVKENFAKYINGKGLDTKLPLVADYYGALINISFQNVDIDAGEVQFYAPVFSGVRYKHAKVIDNYSAAFTDQLKNLNIQGKDVVFSCNCILNYLYSELEGKQTPPFVGPITFGEIAYQLLNQTLVYLSIQDS